MYIKSIHVVAAVGGTEIQVHVHVQMKTKASLTVMKAEGNAFPLPAHIWLAFLKC